MLPTNNLRIALTTALEKGALEAFEVILYVDRRVAENIQRLK